MILNRGRGRCAKLPEGHPPAGPFDGMKIAIRNLDLISLDV
jgi:hypothetical protein